MCRTRFIRWAESPRSCTVKAGSRPTSGYSSRWCGSIRPTFGLFRANLRQLADYPRLSAYFKRTLAFPGVRETVNLDHIKRGYYSIKALNPTGIVPTGPELAWAA
jgi:hypothetical protein